jgi:hypothetical protein
MFIFTAKVNRKKLLTGIIFILAVIIVAVIVAAASRGATKEASLTSVVKTNEERVEYLKGLGWQVSDEPIDEQIITIPSEFDEVYTEYNELQKTQGFDLTKYAGLEATRYTYEVTNYPDTADRVVADIIVYRNRIVAGDVQSTALDGFMESLTFPKG